MEYTGKLYGKINRTYFPMIQTAADFDAMKRERDAIEEKLSQTCEPLHEFVAESDMADGTEAGYSVAMVAVQYGRSYRRQRDEARGALARLCRAVSRRMMPDEPTPEDRMELREAFDAASSLLENS